MPRGSSIAVSIPSSRNLDGVITPTLERQHAIYSPNRYAKQPHTEFCLQANVAEPELLGRGPSSYLIPQPADSSNLLEDVDKPQHLETHGKMCVILRRDIIDRASSVTYRYRSQYSRRTVGLAALFVETLGSETGPGTVFGTQSLLLGQRTQNMMSESHRVVWILKWL